MTALVMAPPLPSSSFAAWSVTGRAWAPAVAGSRRLSTTNRARMNRSPGPQVRGLGCPVREVFAQLRRRAQRESAKGQGTVGAPAGHTGRGSGHEEIVVLMGASPGIGDAGVG